ncbi:MAG: helix-turn-helix transcriptional regulator [Methanobacteriota archaeon]|nr:MAG: helix-turn-helix transcriptional regulator [Euryarchaeota archaeon]
MLTSSEPATEVRVEPQPQKVERRFAELVETCSRFSREILRDAGWNGGSLALLDPVAMNVEIARTVFGKWSLDILTLLYVRQGAGFQEIRRGLGRISSRVLSSKLTRMQETGLIRRDVKPSRPPRVTYSLTDRGLTVAKLGEPVFLYLRLSSGTTARTEAVH